MALLLWSRLDGRAVVGSFISRRVQPCQKRVHVGYEHQGSADQMWMRQRRLHEDEINQRIADLFNLADLAYQPLSIIVHAFKLIRPAPKVPPALVLLCQPYS
jgi:hypothetical protein